MKTTKLQDYPMFWFSIVGTSQHCKFKVSKGIILLNS